LFVSTSCIIIFWWPVSVTLNIYVIIQIIPCLIWEIN
jgi:hypothetical protein